MLHIVHAKYFLNNSLYKGYVLLSLVESISNILKRKYNLFF